MATRKTKDCFTVEQQEAIIQIISNVEYDTEQIANDIVGNKQTRTTLAEELLTSAWPIMQGSPKFTSLVDERAAVQAASIAEQVGTALIARGVDDLTKRIEAALKSADKPDDKKRKARKVAEALGSSAGTVGQLARFIMQYAPPADALTPIMLAGEQGCGKTYETRMLAEHYDHYTEVQCFTGMEARDFVGGYLPDGKGNIGWCDMGITPAFRAAAAGKSTLLLIDELYRVADRERNIFLGMLSPVVSNGVEVYRLQIDNNQNGRTEVIEAPCHLLSIVATTNIGAQFNVGDDDWAGKERWTTHYVYANADQIASCVSTELGKFGVPTTFATNFTAFWQEMCQLKKQGVVSMTPTVRTLCRAIRLARVDGGDETDTIIRQFVHALKVIAPMWAGTDLDGRVNEAQLKLINSTAHRVFGVPQPQE